MNNYFTPEILNKIKNYETGIHQIENFLKINECEEIIEYLRNLKNKSVGKSQTVEREESTKIFFDFNQSEDLRKLRKRIEEIIGEFYVNDFQPHIITSRYPLRLHVDTGKNPNDVIYKNVIIPLEIIYSDEKNSKPPNTIIFKNKWYHQSALFTKFTESNYDFIIKDKSGKFVDILNIKDFYNHIKDLTEIDTLYDNKSFFVNDAFKKYIKYLADSKRYNLRTDKHINNDIEFDLKNYDTYMTHQPYEDCKSLEIDKVIEWKIGKLIYWDRCRIHSSDNFLKNNVVAKTTMAFFTSKTKF
tara:strand:+ start:490 stop:1389 length:900 start_codon:yes stop_codon:yes gene_type:complete